MSLKTNSAIDSDALQQVALVLAFLLATVPAQANPASHNHSYLASHRLLAQSDGSDAQGTITKDKIKTVVEIKVRQAWRPIPGPDGVFAIVDFRVNGNGQISVCEIKKSSGQSAFDQSCLDAVRALGSLPPLPPYLGREMAFFGKFLAGKQPSLEVSLASSGMPSAPAMSPSSSGAATSSASATSSNPGSMSAGNTSSSPNTSTMATVTPGQSDWVTPPSSTSTTTSSSNDGSSGGMDMDGLMAAVGGLSQSSGQPPPVSSSQPTMGGSGQPGMGGSAQPTMGGSPQPTKPMQATGGTSPGAQPSAAQKPGGAPAPNTVPPSADLAATLNNLNNQAVIAINDSNYEFAVRKLEEALKIDPTYASAKSNLAIAYNNYALQLQGQNRTEEALKILHRAYAIDPTNAKTKTNLEAIIQIMGKSPTSFKDRVDLANRCVTIGDAIGAKIEYEAALAIKRDPMVLERLQALAGGRMPAGGPPTAHTNKPPATTNKPPVKQPAGHPTNQQQPLQGESGDTGGGAENTAQQSAPATSKPAGGAVSQKLNTLYKGLSNLEKKTFLKTFETDDILTRLSRVETKLLGKTQTGDPIRRLDTLLLLQ